ncbi:putative S-adenosylmethionine carrier 2, chloroplastic [Porphyridium purpureum]|uniref:Putative S-adenosylmethionine carrier 2, chloroplastic n=1 Tax=Porphyridium purpureum TaxID=35688 RepID=A0A5J4Z4N9_PORPP|nr:putative S-adenosylmethionine carrier 2, chloroplastic [Porphyridium purpureum]|eukprot:POR4286..scf295_1
MGTVEKTRHEKADGPQVDAADVARRSALAGALAGMNTSILLHPLDTIKTMRQTDPRANRGIFLTGKRIVESRGWRALYAGMWPSMLGSAPSSAVYFGTYEYVRNRLAASGSVDLHISTLRLPINLVAAASGNIASSFIFVPKEVIKQRLQSNYAPNVFAVVRKLYAELGFVGFYAGYLATLFRNVPSNALKFVLYEEAKRLLFIRHGKRQDATTQLSPVEHVVAGAFAGMISSSITTPMDVCKTKFATGTNGLSRSVPALLVRIFREEGIAGLYVGSTSRILWAAFFSAIGFSSYEFFKRILIPSNKRVRWTSFAQRPNRRRVCSTARYSQSSAITC